MRNFIPTRIFSFAALPILLASLLRAGTLTGRFELPLSNQSLAGATLQLTLSQAATLPGSFAVVPSTVACYTTRDGSVVGLPDPVAALSITAQSGIGALPAGTYFVQWTYISPGGSSLPGPSASYVLTSPGELLISPPALQPAAATGYAIFIGSSAGSLSLQYSGPFTSYAQSAALASGAAPPTVNSSLCSLVFNDSTVPAPTYYVATLTDAQGNLLAGFPQSWYLSGSSVDVSQLIPLSTNPSVRFPQPILASPSSASPQSLASPLNLNGFALEDSSNAGPSLYTLNMAGALPHPTATLTEWTPNAAVILRRLSLYAAVAGAGGSAGATLSVTDGGNTCIFTGLLAAASTFASNGLPSGACSFSAGIPLTLSVTADDHTTPPANLVVTLEMTAR